MIAITFATEQFILKGKRERIWYTNLTYDSTERRPGTWSRMCFDTMLFDVAIVSQFTTELNKSILLSTKMGVFNGKPYLYETCKRSMRK